jgi:group I intron endonuclease
MKKSGVYKLICLSTLKTYVGSSQDLNKRKLDHKSLLRNGKHPNKYLQRSWNKYNNLKFEVLEECDTEFLLEREQYYIDVLKPEYNLRQIAESNRGWKMPEHAKQKLSIKNKGRSVISKEGRKSISRKNKINLKGRKLPKEHVESIRKARTGWKLSKNTKEKIRQKAIGRDKGKIMLESSKDKISKSNGKKVHQYDLNERFIKSYASCSKAGEDLGINRSSIAACCRGRRKTAGKFKWYYEKQNNKK